ncbi:MAG: hypothetical protein ABFC71_04850 [Methanoregula sp.]
MALNIPILLVGAMGIVVFISLITTASMGMFMAKGKPGFTLRRHATMAGITIGLVIVHGLLAAGWYFGI